MKTSTLAKHCLLSIGVLLALAACTNGRQDAANTVVAYVSEDQVFSEPILRDFERETGIRVQVVFDTEETKSTGVMNRLLAEKDNPQADVFWANEPIRAEYLKQQGIAVPYVSPNAAGIPDHFKDPEGYWTGFSARSRPFVANQCCPGKVTPTDGKSLPLNVLWPVLPGNDLKSRGRKWPPERSIPTRHNGG